MTVLALATVSACADPGTGFTSAQPSAPAGAFGATAPPAPPAASSGSCNVYASSPAPSASDATGKDVAAIKSRGVLKVGVAADQYLTGYLGSDGVEQGFDIDLAHAIAQALFGNPNAVQFVALSTDRRIPDLTAPTTVDMVIDTMTITCDRLSKVGFSAVYYNASQKVLVEKGSGYQSLADLGGKNVCAQSGSTSISLIQHAASKPVAIQVTDISDCLVLLEENKVSAISTDDTILAGLAQQDPNLEVLPAALETEPYGIAVPHGETDLEGYVNGVLAHYEADGGWAASYSHWFAGSLGAANPPGARYSN
ncbi:glutamate ABC transporter substrate-binding protein [Actinospica sp.]|uniref:glutamate ABC transporter substrate-binding protein n=1 Tax=Actinospica sp. TaxID=1872142 RepID=UPI002CE28C60|nr:glutamate ABC transporter substrate-binding protein [Actinospica sp.]HWG27724.1 glutamate ABC transporter substrate-binding protein [Actinospica sp.]